MKRSASIFSLRNGAGLPGAAPHCLQEREREDVSKRLTCFVGAPTGPGVSDDGKEFSPFLSPAHKHPAEEEA